jgi:hypothetical protein
VTPAGDHISDENIRDAEREKSLDDEAAAPATEALDDLLGRPRAWLLGKHGRDHRHALLVVPLVLAARTSRLGGWRISSALFFEIVRPVHS